jgi:hypothetical protein
MNTENWDIMVSVNEHMYWVVQDGFDGPMDVAVDNIVAAPVNKIVAAPVNLILFELVNWDVDMVPSHHTVSQYLNAVGR